MSSEPDFPAVVLYERVALAACGGPQRSDEVRPLDPRATCEAVMHRTRVCRAVYVPELLRLRVRLDRPNGIAVRYTAEGWASLLSVAHAQFESDWSDEAIRVNCDALIDRPAAEQEAILAPERTCLPMTDCAAFAACDLANKERRWRAELASPADDG